MKEFQKAIAIVLALLAQLGMAQMQEGDDVPNLCWSDVNSQEVCYHDFDPTIRVLVYTNGHCPSCEALVTGLVARAREVADQKVTFLLLSTEGKTPGSPPDARFLAEWKASFAKSGHPWPANFVAAASPQDAGSAFFDGPDLPVPPTVVVTDTDETLAFASQKPNVDEILSQIQDLKPDPASAPAPTSR